MYKGDNFEWFGVFAIDYWTYVTTLSFGFCEIIVVYIKLCSTPTILRLWLLLTSTYLFVFTDGNLAEVCRLSPQRRSPVLSRKNRESKFFPLGDTLCSAFHVLTKFLKPDPHATPISALECPQLWWLVRSSGQEPITGGIPHDGLYGEAPPERGAFFSLRLYNRVGISQVEVYGTVGKSVIQVFKGLLIKKKISNRRTLWPYIFYNNWAIPRTDWWRAMSYVACVAGVKRGRGSGNLSARGRKLTPSIPFFFPFELLPRRLWPMRV